LGIKNITKRKFVPCKRCLLQFKQGFHLLSEKLVQLAKWALFANQAARLIQNDFLLTNEVSSLVLQFVQIANQPITENSLQINSN
jgi:hypothetical protein